MCGRKEGGKEGDDKAVEEVVMVKEETVDLRNTSITKK